MKPGPKKLVILIASIAISQLAGVIGSIFTVKNIPTWYSTLNKPSFNPPNWLFGPVWTLLYTLMGISLFLIIAKQKRILSPAVSLFLVHLGVNSLWSIAFFGMKQIGLAFAVIAILWILIFYLIKIFRKINKTASNLLVPYLAWVSFASLLNLSIWLLN